MAKKHYKQPSWTLLRVPHGQNLLSNFSLGGDVWDYDGTEQDDF